MNGFTATRQVHEPVHGSALTSRHFACRRWRAPRIMRGPGRVIQKRPFTLTPNTFWEPGTPPIVPQPEALSVTIHRDPPSGPRVVPSGEPPRGSPKAG